MDVHHAGHITEEKKWKEYMFHFMMLFLAVFLGFLAEYTLEHIIEKQQGREYIRSFAEDLKADTVTLGQAITFAKQRAGVLDSLVYLLNAQDPDKNGAALYYYARKSTRSNHFTFADRTILQLTNSGGFRLIRDNVIADSILNYHSSIESYKDYLGTEERESDFLYPFISQIFKSPVFIEMVDSNNVIHAPEGNPVLLSKDKLLINQFIYYVHQRKSTFLAENIILKSLLHRATGNLDLINKKYHFQ